MFISHFMALLIKRIQIFKRDTRGFVCEIFLPCLVVVAGLSIMLIKFNFESPPNVLSGDLYEKPQDLLYSADPRINPPEVDSLMKEFSSDYFKTEFYPAKDIVDWDEENFKKLDKFKRKGSYFINDLVQSPDMLSAVYTAEVTTISRSTPPYYINRMNTALLRKFTNNKQANIQITVHPMPLTNRIKSFE